MVGAVAIVLFSLNRAFPAPNLAGALRGTPAFVPRHLCANEAGLFWRDEIQSDGMGSLSDFRPFSRL
jgi:hypothetical protein